ncbi:MAG: sulfotransferase family protein [Gammaproteobacteria bacterium]|nr:MAG: sulfotransferase family protein [Gammaproteobacteria bacterium]
MIDQRKQIDARLEQAKSLLENSRLVEAEKHTEKILSDFPRNAEALYILAVCQRYLNRLEEALKTLSRLKKIRPGYGRAFQEEGHVCVKAGFVSQALNAYRHAVNLNNSLIASWAGLTKILKSQGKEKNANITQHEYEKLKALPVELLSVRNMIAEGKNFQAERLCRKFLMENKKNIEGMRLLASLGVAADVLDDAEFLLEKALEYEPNNNFARNDYMEVLYKRQKYQKSLKQAEILRKKEPKNLKYQIAYANQAVAVGKYKKALKIYDQANKALPNNPELRLVHGHALKTIGNVDEAIEAYRKSYNARNDYGDAYWSLANLKTYRFTPDEVLLMDEKESSTSTIITDRIHLNFALGKYYEDSKLFDKSFVHYERGNELQQSQQHYKKEHMTDVLNLQIEYCNSALFESKKEFGHDAADPIFIVGLPRAGSTLLEQILASHSKVEGTLELPNIPALAYKLAGRKTVNETPDYPKNLSTLSAETLEKFGKDYLDETRIHRTKLPHFIDKMPNNFRHIALIHLILPNAKIIDARRNPMACCFSGFKQLFASGQQFSYGLEEIGTYYKDYVEVMNHWDKVLPGKILRVQYEDVVSNLENEVTRILEYCNLPFEDNCINFHKTERNVRTPSSEQVRQPIYKSGLEQWKNYEPWLDPLKKSLGNIEIK